MDYYCALLRTIVHGDKNEKEDSENFKRVQVKA